ncbi:sensor histidine kinase [Ferrovibrio sp.]|uniref:sensor histidine kinase n=1 Tax=Ferrovibrio sp. TaxID=1917215 RepID=UPI003D0F2A45
MMLDVRTLIFATFVLAIGVSLAWLPVWRGQRHLPGVRTWLLATICAAAGLVLLALRGVVDGWLSVIVGNLLAVHGQVLVMFAFADVLGQQRPQRLGYGITGLTAVLWPVLWFGWPDELGLRQTIYACFAISLFSYIGWMLIRDRTLPHLQRLPGIVFSIFHAGILLLHGVSGALLSEGAAYLRGTAMNIFWAFENTLSVIAFTVAFAVLLGARLTADLQRRNLALAEEIEAQRGLQSQLRSALDAEASLRREQQRFITRVSRDFDEPLHGITHNAERLGNLPPPLQASIQPRLDAIGAAAQRLRTLIDTFLLDHRIHGGMAEMRRDPVELGALLADLMREHGRPGGRPGAEWRLRLTRPDTAVTARGDAAMLAIVFGNLIDNALKYSGVETTVDVSLAREHDEAVVIVQDQGIGIPERDLGAIGRRFFRAGNTANVPGTGLGLFSAARLIQFHGGRFLVDSSPETGTRITVHLPLHDSVAAA